MKCRDSRNGINFISNEMRGITSRIIASRMKIQFIQSLLIIKTEMRIFKNSSSLNRNCILNTFHDDKTMKSFHVMLIILKKPLHLLKSSIQRIIRSNVFLFKFKWEPLSLCLIFLHYIPKGYLHSEV